MKEKFIKGIETNLKKHSINAPGHDHNEGDNSHDVKKSKSSLFHPDVNVPLDIEPTHL